jgi:sigma-B regulation protein RsbU (phosphoserine phosphatase)
VQPLLLRASGELLELPGGGLPVGLMPMSRYEEMTIAVGPGDTLLVVSDGFMEVSNPNDEFWEESKLGELLKAHGGKPTSELPAALCAEADAWANGAEQHDDMTMVAIRIEN